MTHTFRRAAALVLLFASTPVAVDAATPATRPTPPAAASVTPMDVGELLTSLRGGNFAAVIDAAAAGEVAMRKSGVKPLDPVLANVQHVHAVALGRQGKVKQAADLLQRISPLAASNRSLLMNLAISDLSDAALLPRSVKNLQAYATAHPTDEDAINLWGAAMAKIGGANKASAAKLKEWESAYNAVNAKLEAARADKSRHWGSSWISRHDFADIDDRRRAAQQTITYREGECRQADRNVEAAKRELFRLQNEIVRDTSRYWNDYERRDHDRRVASAEEAVNRAVDNQTEQNIKLRDAMSAMPRPTWLAAVEMLEPELLP